MRKSSTFGCGTVARPPRTETPKLQLERLSLSRRRCRPLEVRFFRPWSGEELVIEPFQRLIREQQLAAYEYDGFFSAMDTFKDKQRLDDLCEGGQPPWEIWRTNGGSPKTMTSGVHSLAGDSRLSKPRRKSGRADRILHATE